MKILNSLSLVIFTGLIIWFSSCSSKKSEAEKEEKAVEKPNVLFISIDDLRPEIGAYGNTKIITPNLDRLAGEGMLFEQAFCQVPVCGASRASLLTGMMPQRNRFVDYPTRVDEDAPNVTTLPGHFKNNGYHTVNLGKMFHHPDDMEQQSWSEPAVRLDWEKLPDGTWSTEGWRDYVTEANHQVEKNHPGGAGPPYENADVPDNAYVDGKTTDLALEKLKELKGKDEPFFLAVGFLKPHLPFNAPKKYWDLYESSSFALPENYYPPKDVAKEAMFNWGELRAYAHVPKEGPVPDTMATKLLHGYYASISYTDALVGKLLDQLKALDLDKNTIVVMWSDHGYFLGEHTLWCKHSLFELSSRVSLMVKGPGVKSGTKTKSITELVDIYPTLCDLAGLEKPAHLQGKSFLPVLQNPETPHKPYAFTRYYAGESVKKGQFRYAKYTTEEGELLSENLFDHQTDPEENINIAANQSETTAKLGAVIEEEKTRVLELEKKGQ